MIVETVMSLILILPGILLLVYKGELEYSLSTMQRPAYSMVSPDVWKKSNNLLGVLLSVGGIVSLLIGLVSTIEYEFSFIAAYAIAIIVIVSEYSYRLFLLELMKNPGPDEDTEEVLESLSKATSIAVSTFSAASTMIGIASLLNAYKLGLYSVIPVQSALIALLVYVTFNCIERSPFLAYPWIPLKWIKRISILVPLLLSTLVLVISIILLS
ncbi:MAG: hypothetical protein GSR79_00025 [Desulfurococcales archaeon]|nr:hypothetical protein [Desulfurococcales archaeon]